jgi:hypothetical protein
MTDDHILTSHISQLAGADFTGICAFVLPKKILGPQRYGPVSDQRLNRLDQWK